VAFKFWYLLIGWIYDFSNVQGGLFLHTFGLGKGRRWAKSIQPIKRPELGGTNGGKKYD
jgi:hypothetical protein